MSNIIINILKMSLFSSIIIFLLMVVKKLFGNKLNIKIIIFMWVIVLARLIVPYTITSPISIGNILFNEVKEASNTQETASNTVDENQENYGIYSTAESSFPYNYLSNNSYSENIEYTSDVQVKQEENISWIKKTTDYLTSISIWTYAFIIWITGASAFLTINIYRMIVFCRKANTKKRPLRYRVRQILDKNIRMLGIKKDVEVVISSYIDMPISFGIIRPKILIPHKIASTLSYDKIDLIIKHELGHVKRQDILKTYLWMMAKSIHWFNPLVTIAFKIYQNDIEFACDYTITRKLDIQKRIEYSQSLIDVIKITQYSTKAPLAVHFCRDKLKLEERIMNMIKPQKKSKSAGLTAILFTVIMIIGCFTTACQPTPEDLVVQNKADDNLQEAIAQTATPTPSDTNTSDNNVTSETASTNQQDTQTNEPIGHIEDISSNASNTVTVEINADVINNQPDNIPVVKIEPKEFTEQEVQQIVQAFFGNTQLYSRDLTKEDYDEWILSKQLELNDEEKLKVYAADRNIEDLSEARNQLEEAIERLKRERANAADNRATADYSELYSEHGFNLLIDTGKGFLGNVKASKDSVLLSAFNDSNSYYLERSIIRGMSLDLNSSDKQYQEAKQRVLGLISKIKINSVLGDAYLVNDNRDDPNRQYYVFCFEMKINETSIDHTLDYGNLPTGGPDAEVYEILRRYERLEIWIENGQFVQLRYLMPMNITEVLNDNVALNIDYNKAVKLAKQHAYVSYVDTYGNYTEAKLNINKIELIMTRTKERENGDYIVVPAWNFSGTISKRYKDTDQRSDVDENGWKTITGNGGLGDTLITINALDGTIINRAGGY